MERYPKSRTPAGTLVVIKGKKGYEIITLLEWMRAFACTIYQVSFTRGPLKSWIRSAEFHEKVRR